MLLKWRDWLKENEGEDSVYVDILPVVNFYKSNDLSCFTIGWLFWQLQFWFGKEKDLKMVV